MGGNENSGWHRFMSISPPTGSLSAALLAWSHHGAGTGRKYHYRSDRVMAQQLTKAARRGWICARRLIWPLLNGVLLHRRVLAHPWHRFPFGGLSANVFSLTGYGRLSTAFIKEQAGWIAFHSPTAQKSIKTKHLQRNFLKIFQTGTCPSAPSGGNVYIFISIRRCCMYANNILFP